VPRGAGSRNRKRGVRPRIRDAVACTACGAGAGEPCVSYTGKNGTVNGTASPDVHAARWYAWVGGFAQQRAAQLRLGGLVGDGPAR
jgi:hypothetical protein